MPNLGSTALNVTFDLLLGLGSSAEGVSFVYGPMPAAGAAFGEMGTGLGSPPPSVGGWAGGPGLEVLIRRVKSIFCKSATTGAPALRRMYGAARANAFRL